MSRQWRHVLVLAGVLLVTFLVLREVSKTTSIARALSRGGVQDGSSENITIRGTRLADAEVPFDSPTPFSVSPGSMPGARIRSPSSPIEELASSFSWRGTFAAQSEDFLDALFHQSVGSDGLTSPWRDALCDTKSTSKLVDVTKGLMQSLTSQALELPGCLAHLPPYQRAVCLLAAGASPRNTSRASSLKDQPTYRNTWCARMNPCALWSLGTFRVPIHRSTLRALYAFAVLPKIAASRHIAKPFVENFVHRVDLGFESNDDGSSAAAALESEMRWLPQRLAATVEEVQKWASLAAKRDVASNGTIGSYSMASTNVLPVFQGSMLRLASDLPTGTTTSASNLSETSESQQRRWTSAQNINARNIATSFLPFLSPIEVMALLYQRLHDRSIDGLEVDDGGTATVPAMLFSGDSQTRELFFMIVSYLRSESTAEGKHGRRDTEDSLTRHNVVIDTLKHHDVVYAVHPTGDVLTLCSSRWNPAAKLPTVVEYVSRFRNGDSGSGKRQEPSKPLPLFLIVFMWDPYTHRPRRDVWGGNPCGTPSVGNGSALHCRNSRGNATALSVAYERMVAAAIAACASNSPRFCQGQLSMRSLPQVPVAVHVEGSRQWETTVREGIAHEWDQSVCDAATFAANIASGGGGNAATRTKDVSGGTASCVRRAVPLFYTLSSTAPYVLGRDGRLVHGSPRIYERSLLPNSSSRNGEVPPAVVSALPQQVRKTYDHLHWLHQVSKDHGHRQRVWRVNRTRVAGSAPISGTRFRVGMLDLAKLQMLPDVVMLDRTHFLCQVYRAGFSAHFRLAQTALPLNNLLTPFPWTEPRAPLLSDICPSDGNSDRSSASPQLGEVFARLFSNGPLRKHMEPLNGIRGNEVRNAYRTGLPVHKKIMYLAPKMPPGACRSVGGQLMMQLLLRDMAT